MAKRNISAALFLVACLILGGSVQGTWGMFALQLAGLLLVVSAVNRNNARPVEPRARPILWLAGLAVLLLALQMIPLPSAIWSALPGRGLVVEGLESLGERPASMTWSMAPYSTLAAAFALIVPMAMFVAIVFRPETSRRLLVAALLAGTFAGCLLGVLQIVGGGESWYLYRYSAFGDSTGFFANSNHLGTLLLISAPFLVALASEGADTNRDAQQRRVIRTAAGAGAVLLAVSIVLNRSLAVQLLCIPVAAGCVAMVARGRPPEQRRFIAIGTVVAIIGAALFFLLARERYAAAAQESLSSRMEIWTTSLKAASNSGFAGSGFGTFAEYYRHFENPAAVARTYVNHAHNDYLEMIVEGGAAAALLMVLFLGWWAMAAVRAWRSVKSDIYARAATLASATILLHSIVDYPLRTSALAAVFAMCLALMCLRPSVVVGGHRSDFRATRHRAIR